MKADAKTITVGETRTLDIDEITPYWRNPRRIPPEAVDGVAESIKKYGYQQPIVVDESNTIVVGHTRLQALKKLGYKKVEVHVTNLPPEKVREYRIVDNKTSELTSWDHNALVLELREFEDDLLQRYFPDVDLEINMLNQQSTTERDVEDGTRKALTLKEVVPTATVEVTCPSCFHRFAIKAAALPGINANELAAG